MAEVNKFFAALKYIIPSDMEYFLEESSAEGLKLLDLGQSSVFAMKFVEEQPEKVKYAVDCSGLSKSLYMQTILDKGWEYMGTSLNCYVWRKPYEGADRPEDFTDKTAIAKHCMKQGIVFAAVAVILLVLYTLMIIELVAEFKMGKTEHIPLYSIAMTVQLPLLLYSVWASVKLIKYAVPRMKDK
jgi:hypothetical protein